jgi:membrane protein implicated in regulation of membrane protease activity
MTDVTLWLVAAGLLLVAELFSGTFYLLMLAAGMLAGAVAAHFGAIFDVQLVAASLTGIAAVVIWHHIRRRKRLIASMAENELDSLDVGQVVEVEQWKSNAQTRVYYRGAWWSASLRATDLAALAGAPFPGSYKIVDVQGTTLILTSVT